MPRAMLRGTKRHAHAAEVVEPARHDQQLPATKAAVAGPSDLLGGHGLQPEEQRARHAGRLGELGSVGPGQRQDTLTPLEASSSARASLKERT